MYNAGVRSAIAASLPFFTVIRQRWPAFSRRTTARRLAGSRRARAREDLARRGRHPAPAISARLDDDRRTNGDRAGLGTGLPRSETGTRSAVTQTLSCSEPAPSGATRRSRRRRSGTVTTSGASARHQAARGAGRRGYADATSDDTAVGIRDVEPLGPDAGEPGNRRALANDLPLVAVALAATSTQAWRSSGAVDVEAQEVVHACRWPEVQGRLGVRGR